MFEAALDAYRRGSQLVRDDPAFQPKRLQDNRDVDNQQLRELEQLMAEKKGTGQ